MSKFICFSLSPIELSRPSIAIATVKAGGVGIVDREFCPDENLDLASKNLNTLLNAVSDRDSNVGLRLRADRIETSQILLDTLSKRPHWLILCEWKPESLAETIKKLPISDICNLLLEVSSAEQLEKLAIESLPIRGILAKGSESGGWIGIGADPAFILTQKLLKTQKCPVYVRGGIGVHTAAACRAIGASGVMVDDRLLLMPESPVSKDWQEYFKNISGQEARIIGERLDRSVRVFCRHGFEVTTKLENLAQKLEIENSQQEDWTREANKLIGWKEAGVKAWPVGQGVGLALADRDRYKTTGRFIQAILKGSLEHIKTSIKLKPLASESPLAKSHGTLYPIVQGPMTRVSDTAEFANAVARFGALPMLALSLMRSKQVEKLLYQAKELIGDRPWGIGILGFIPPALREEQLKVIKKVKPPFAIIAGGRPDRAAQLEQEGIATYLHVPTVKLLQMFYEEGARRFIFEGRECGGHIGPLSSFVLWESTIEMLLNEVPATIAKEIHVLFAGGIHDARSAAMISAMAAPLADRGMKIGVLMGTAYIFTSEAVECGAIVQQYQQKAVECTQTINLETGPGHASRCVVTPFTREFYAARQKMLADGVGAEQIKNSLEEMTMGRLRIASKGLERRGSEIVEIDSKTQLEKGMYTIGQAATIQKQIFKVEELHREVCENHLNFLAKTAPTSDRDRETRPSSQPANIAIVGIATLLPKANQPDTFWENILDRVNAISEIPPHRWDWRLYYDSERQTRDKIYSKWGGFIEDVPFDPIRFGIPPKSLKSIEPMQILTLEAVRRALLDAGYENGDFDREYTSVILGASGGLSDLGQQYATRAEIPRMVAKIDANTWERLPDWTEESFPGLLFNVTAGRVANRFDLGGSNYTVDAACASSLAAIDLAVNELETGRCNVAIAGGVDTVQSAFSYFCFSKTQALSPQGVARSFDKSADGIVISEGIAVLILKRLADAERDGDRIYALIKSTASSSDGKGLSMTAPASSGQKRALNRAYRKAGICPSTIGLYEAHGTGTIAGDKAESQTIKSILDESQAASKSVVIGSVKTTIGHTKSSAGVVALIKASLSLYHKVLPPQTNIENPLDALQAEDSPLYLLKEAKPWLSRNDYPRRAGVSAFGFGGTNFHAVLEEYQGQNRDVHYGAKAWPWELIVWRARDRQSLNAQLTNLLKNLLKGAKPKLRDLAYSCAKLASDRQNLPVCLSLVTNNLEDLIENLKFVLSYLQSQRNLQSLPSHIRLNLGDRSVPAGKIAFLFPGQAAQYPGMGKEVAIYCQEMREAIELGDRQLQGYFPKALSQYVYPPSAYSEAETSRAKTLLNNTHVAQPAIGAIATGYLDLVSKLGLKPDMLAGHSYGEYIALHAAGVISRQDLLQLSEMRGRVMAKACQTGEGAMAVVNLTRSQLESRLANNPDVIIACHNSPTHAVISGKKAAIEKIVADLEAEEITTRILPVSGAFHSELLKSAEAPLKEAIAAIELQPPQIPVYSNLNADCYPSDPGQIRTQLCQHLLQPVEFVEQIQKMHAAGASIFIEVGPKRILTKFVDRILEGKDFTAISLDGQERGIKGFLSSLGTLITEGAKLNLMALFASRDCRSLNLSQLWQLTRPPELTDTTWLVNGGSVRPKHQDTGFSGKIPPLNLETKASAPKTSNINLDREDYSPSEQKFPSKNLNNTSAMNDRNSIREPKVTNPQTNVSQDAALLAYQSYQETMRQFLSLQEQVMKQFLSGDVGVSSVPQQPKTSIPPAPARVSPLLPEATPTTNERAIAPSQPAPVPPTPPEVTATAPQNTTLTRESLIQTLLSLVSDRTGYPEEMLGLDRDIEAELGIDSIKRVEIFGALQKILPEPLASNVKEDMESFTQLKTFNSLIDKLLASVPDGTESLKKSHDAVIVSRYATKGRIESLDCQMAASLQGLFLITEDFDKLLAEGVAARIKQKGAFPVIINRFDLQDKDKLATAIEPLRQQYGKVTGIVHLAGQSSLIMPDNIAQWQEIVKVQSKSLFYLLQLCAEDLQATRGQVIATSLLGGHFGRNGDCGEGLPCAGSSSGLLKTMAIEWPEVRAKVIDFDRQSSKDASDRIVEELISSDRNQEIGYCQGNRLVFEIVSAPLSSQNSHRECHPKSDWVVLSIGGARGITSEIVSELLVPGMTLILIGRSPKPQPEDPATVGIEDISALRKFFIQQARERKESLTPVEIENQVKSLQRARSIRRNLEKFQQVGVKVEYHSLDINDVDRFGNYIDRVYDRFKRIDAVIQGAGIIEDKLIVDKTVSSFDRVFDTKVNSTYVLSRHLRPESLKLVVLFASVAGRTGNRGQVDYAAANEVINRFAWWMQQKWSDAKIMALNWGPWEVTGMATDAVNEQFRKRGIIPIPISGGREFFSKELRYGLKTEVELVAGIFEGVSQEEQNNTSSFPLLLSQPKIQPNSTVTASQTISLATHPYLKDHCLDGKPVLAAACALELMAEFTQATWNDWTVTEVRDLKVFQGIVLKTEAGQNIQLRASASTHADAESLQITAEIVDLDNKKIFYRAFLILRQSLQPAPETDLAFLNARSGLDITSAYRDCCFHGPAFQLLTSIDRFDKGGMDAEVITSNPTAWLKRNSEKGWLFDPGLIDASLQMTSIWVRRQGDVSGLPSRFGSVVRYGQFSPEQKLQIQMRVKSFDLTTVVYDAIFKDRRDDRVYLWLKDIEATCSKALNRLVVKNKYSQ